MDYMNLNGSSLSPMDPEGFPPRRLEGPIEDKVFTQPDSEWTSYADTWWRIFVPEEFRNFWRPAGAHVIAASDLITVTPKGRAKQTLIDEVIFDILGDIEEYFHIKGAGDQNDQDIEQFAGQALKLKRSKDKIAIQSVVTYNNRARTIGHIPDQIAAQIDAYGLKISEVGVEIVEARILNGAKGEEKARYSICLLDLRKTDNDSQASTEEEHCKTVIEKRHAADAAIFPTVIGKTTKLLIRYPNADGNGSSWRKIAPLIVTDGGFIGAMDLGKSLYRTYRQDRILDYLDEDTGDRLSEETVDSIFKAITFECPGQDYSNVHMAGAIMAALMCELSILKLYANAAKLESGRAAQMILEYAKRDARSQPPGRFIPWGERTRAWPIVLAAIEAMQPDPDLIGHFGNTVRTQIHTKTRAENFNTCILAIVDAGEEINAEMQALSNRVNGRS